MGGNICKSARLEPLESGVEGEHYHCEGESSNRAAVEEMAVGYLNKSYSSCKSGNQEVSPQEGPIRASLPYRLKGRATALARKGKGLAVLAHPTRNMLLKLLTPRR